MNVESELLLGPLAGGVRHDQAFLWGRAAGPGKLFAWVGRAPDLSDAELLGESLPLRAEDGFAGVAPLHSLLADTQYFYALTLSGEPPAVGSPAASFRTFPSPRQPAAFNFAFGSCFLPPDADEGAIYQQIDALRQSEDLRFALLIGDQVYSDDHRHNGIGKVACTLDEYREVYRYAWARRPFRRLFSHLPVFMTLDDHEVDDDWTWTDDRREVAQIPIWDRVLRWLQRRPLAERQIPRQRVQDALQAYWEHQGMHAPQFAIQPGLSPTGQYELQQGERGALAYTFQYGAAAFFVLDTRTMRIKTRQSRRLLGEGQWQALVDWLRVVKEHYPLKFIVTSSAFLFQMWLDLARDRWSGFAEERNRLLHFLAAEGIDGVHFLAGDLHSAHAVRAELYGPNQSAIPIWEFCSSPLLQKPNRLARYTYSSLKRAPLKNQDCKFIVSQPNFGLVRVDYQPSGRPVVRYEVYSVEGELLGTAGD